MKEIGYDAAKGALVIGMIITAATGGTSIVLAAVLAIGTAAAIWIYNLVASIVNEIGYATRARELKPSGVIAAGPTPKAGA